MGGSEYISKRRGVTVGHCLAVWQALNQVSTLVKLIGTELSTMDGNGLLTALFSLALKNQSTSIQCCKLCIKGEQKRVSISHHFPRKAFEALSRKTIFPLLPPIHSSQISANPSFFSPSSTIDSYTFQTWPCIFSLFLNKENPRCQQSVLSFYPLFRSIIIFRNYFCGSKKQLRMLGICHVIEKLSWEAFYYFWFAWITCSGCLLAH